MVFPTSFGFNSETAGSNHFQVNEPFDVSKRNLAQQEFSDAVNKLRIHGIDVTVFEDSEVPVKPDAVFPNNWISVHPEGYVLYPMEAENRRTERSQEICEALKDKLNIRCLLDLSSFESKGVFLEGTGSIIFDHIHRKAYAATSSRTNEDLFNELCKKLKYTPITFSSADRNGNTVYHTNVLMAIGTGYAILCEDAIPNNTEKDLVRNELSKDGIEIIPITMDQMYAFAGNMIELTSETGVRYLIMSQTAFNSLSAAQIQKIKEFAVPLIFDVSTIEQFGGGSIRCMIAELFF